jgi:hypothetical protein
MFRDGAIFSRTFFCFPDSDFHSVAFSRTQEIIASRSRRSAAFPAPLAVADESLAIQ